LYRSGVETKNMNSKGLLLDMDGVLFKDKVMSYKVSHNICNYVRRRINPVYKMDHVKSVNEGLYKTFGHTYLGLQAVYGKKSGHLAEFQQQVYTKELIVALKQRCSNPKLNLEDRTNVESILNLCDEHQIPVYIFSNAPLIWCQTIIEGFGFGAKLSDDHYLTPDRWMSVDGAVTGAILKPQKEYYHRVMRVLSDKHGFRMKWIFVDDQLSNLKEVIGNPHFHCVWHTHQPPMYSSSLSSISHLEQLLPTLHI
jgi:FMN phosphatase YigB (HAD superfamily)